MRPMTDFMRAPALPRALPQRIVFAAALPLLATPLVFAQRVDPGRVLESVQPRPAEISRPSAPSVKLNRANASPSPATAEPGGQLEVKRFLIEGARSLPTDRLENAVLPWLGRTLAIAQLQDAAAAVAQVYQDAGYPLARALVLPQSVQDGAVTITVFEDRLASLQFEAAGPLAGPLPAVAADAIRQAQPLGQPVNTQTLEKVLLRVNSLPGSGRASAELLSGEQSVDSSALSIRYQPAARVAGSVQLDNSGNRFTGRSRLVASLVVNEPLGMADQFNAVVLTTGDMLNYGQLGYRLPLSLSTSVGAAVSSLRYDLCCQAVTQPVDGSAQSLSIDLAHVYALQRDRQVAAFGALDLRRLKSNLAGAAQTDRDLQVLRVGARGYWLDAALNNWRAELALGRADLNGNAVDAASDAAGAQVAGRFSKLVVDYGRNQALGSGWSWQLNLRGQANLGRNLESSERFSLGGVDGVRAYPSGEGVGDSGWLASLTARYALPQVNGLAVAAFVDTGEVQRFSKNPAALAGTVPNRYGLSGAGLGLTYDTPAVTMALSVAHPVGSNRGADAAGNNAEGKPDGRTQYWLSVNLRF
jgi:hemolysin activation/secretion protein